MLNHECDQCGACCKGRLLVEAYALDLRREPKLLQASIGSWTAEMPMQTAMEELDQEGKCIIIAGGENACRFLSEDNRCGIYPTRPNVCVAMRAGDEQCQESRETAGLPPLEQYTPPKPQPKSELKGYRWPASRLSARDMEMLAELREQTKKPIAVLGSYNSKRSPK